MAVDLSMSVGRCGGFPRGMISETPCISAHLIRESIMEARVLSACNIDPMASAETARGR